MPPFFVAFLLTPLASNASELLSSLKFAAGKQRRSASLTFAQARTRSRGTAMLQTGLQHSTDCEHPALSGACQNTSPNDAGFCAYSESAVFKQRPSG